MCSLFRFTFHCNTVSVKEVISLGLGRQTDRQADRRMHAHARAHARTRAPTHTGVQRETEIQIES